ncbi:MAG: hypothetical protein HWD58_10920 [Bacteroidota bacterium]|nr:MAG: hypothetical protein HWD58_10920 [Bacteroidota bacterium]
MECQSGAGQNMMYNFKQQASQAFGANQRALASGEWALFCGDINQDGVVDGLDFNDWESDNNNFSAGYFSADLNGDDIVDGLDFCCGRRIAMLLWAWWRHRGDANTNSTQNT